ncbi:major head protein [Clostridium phage phiCTP1]|uniref:major head protein n=1 Tax=Clostridium phage phiCTP1 TaxID=871584 RepID=UPI0001E07819|nr:major head protein [Clostridium phage phiCTP1]ADL40312.1 hypothetical phage protein [Clostridium phage phiCTP1]
MRQSIRTISEAQKQLLAYNDLYLSVNVKVAKADATLDANNKLVAGTIIDATGKTVNDGTAFGVVYEDIDFTDSMGTEVVPVIVFGFINVHNMPTAPSEAVIGALKMIQFIDDGLVTTTTTVAPTTTTSTSQG